MTRRAALAALLSAALAAGVPDPCRADGAKPGSYCPLPEAGEVPQCLAPAQETYGDFFEAVERGPGDDGSLAAVESDVTGDVGPRRYLALSSLAYGYYRLAQRAAATPGEDPRVVARLERWNGLLARAYSENEGDEGYRRAVRSAAEDLDTRVDVVLACSDARGEDTECNSTEAVLRGFNRASDQVGIRGALSRLIGRFWGGEP